MIKFNFPTQVHSDFEGYNSFLGLYRLTKDLIFDNLIIDFEETNWFDANLLAILGSILSNAQSSLNDIKIINLRHDVARIFSKNHFLSNFGGEKIDDYYGTTIKYKRFKSSEENESFLIDTNVWLYLFCPLSNYKTYQIKPYKTFFDVAIKNGSVIYITSLILSEFINRDF